MKVWWLTINRAMKNTYLGLKYRKVIAQGWPGLGDLSILANYFSPYWQENRPDFERLIQLLACPIYPADAAKPPAALKNLYNLMNIAQGDLVVAVESAQGAGTALGICQAERNAWDSYRWDGPEPFDYAHTVCFPVNWIDMDSSFTFHPDAPAMIAGVQPMGASQADQVKGSWGLFQHKSF